MSATFVSQSNMLKNGTCPHGAPLGACPICNGMGGGMLKRADHNARPGEMSWSECAAIGAMLRAQKKAKMQRLQDYINFAQRLADFDKKMMRLMDRTENFVYLISDKLPKIFAVPISAVIKVFVLSGLRLIKNVPLLVQNITKAISSKALDISDKISAVIGEIKTAILKKAGEIVVSVKKKLKSLFGMFSTQDSDNESKEINEDKKIFNIRTFINDLYSKLKNDSEEEEE